MDFNMPVMDGIAATKLIKKKIQKKLWPHVGIIIVSAYSNQEDVDKFYKSGCDRYISKHVSDLLLF